MPRNSKDATYDTATLLKDAGLVAATAAATVGGSAPNAIIPLGAGRGDFRVIVDATAIEVDSGNELYTILFQLSNSATFASGVFGGPAIRLGHSSTTLSSASTAVGRREMGVCNEINGTVFAFARLQTIVAGTIASGVNYTAYLVQA